MSGLPDPNLDSRKEEMPRHVAIIMDGNGRWAETRGQPRAFGHRQGVEAVRRTVRAAGDLGIEYLSLYSFSTENWSRPETEITELFSLLRHFIRMDLADLHKNNVRVKVIGNRERVPDDVLALLDEARNLTKDNTGQTLVIAFNYGARAEIAEAARRVAAEVSKDRMLPEEITEDCFGTFLDTADIPDPELLIRTSGEMRLSNFLLWQLAYSELIFLDCYWPDFSREHLVEAIRAFHHRNRRFGGLVMETGS